MMNALDSRTWDIPTCIRHARARQGDTSDGLTLEATAVALYYVVNDVNDPRLPAPEELYPEYWALWLQAAEVVCGLQRMQWEGQA